MFVSEAGAQFLTGLRGNVAIPKQTGSTTAYWVAENGEITESDAQFSQVTMTPHTVGAMQEISRKLLLQSSPDVENLIRHDFANVLAREIDRVAIEDNPDASATANEPRGIIYTSGIGSVAGGTNGAAPTRDHLIDLERELEIDNVGMARPAYAFSPKVKAKLAKTALDAGSGRFVLESPTEVNGHRYFSSTLVPDDLTKGSASGVCSAIIMADWAQLAVGVWDQLTILADPYSGSASGKLKLVAFADVDCALRQPAAAAVMLDALTA
jgi:HK97 family phage major capsid protein